VTAKQLRCPRRSGVRQHAYSGHSDVQATNPQLDQRSALSTVQWPSGSRKVAIAEAGVRESERKSTIWEDFSTHNK
jgi:hypothetical protein